MNYKLLNDKCLQQIFSIEIHLELSSIDDFGLRFVYACSLICNFWEEFG